MLDDWKKRAAFTTKGFDVEIFIDDMKRWRIYVEKNEQMKIMPYDIPPHDEYSYYCSNDSSFSLEDYPLPLWNYGDKIGLDDFPIAELTKYNNISVRKKEIVSFDKIKELAVKLVDSILAYQINFPVINEYRRFDYNISQINSQASKLFTKKDLKELMKLNGLIEGLKI